NPHRPLMKEIPRASTLGLTTKECGEGNGQAGWRRRGRRACSHLRLWSGRTDKKRALGRRQPQGGGETLKRVGRRCAAQATLHVRDGTRAEFSARGQGLL